MANEITKKTWLLDSAGQVSTSKLVLARIDWTGNTGDGDDLVIKEVGSSADIIVQAKAYHTNQDMSWYFDEDVIYNGMSLDTLDGGKVLVTLRDIY